MHAVDFNNIVTSGGNFSANQTYTQVIEWIDFIGGSMFCEKVHNPANPNAAEVGRTYSTLANYNAISKSFVVGSSDDMSDPRFYPPPLLTYSTV